MEDEDKRIDARPEIQCHEYHCGRSLTARNDSDAADCIDIGRQTRIFAIQSAAAWDMLFITIKHTARKMLADARRAVDKGA